MTAVAGKPMTIRKLADDAVNRLVSAHRELKDEALVLAVRYKISDPSGDVHLLEVLDRFPGGDDDELLITEFPASPNLLILGTLHLALGSPAQVRAAVRRGDSIVKAVRKGKAVFDDGSDEARALKDMLGL